MKYIRDIFLISIVDVIIIALHFPFIMVILLKNLPENIVDRVYVSINAIFVIISYLVVIIYNKKRSKENEKL